MLKTIIASVTTSLVLAGTTAGTPAVGTSTDDVDLRTVPGSVPYEDGYAIPLKGARPSWYTDELAAQVEALGVVAAPLDAPLPSEVGIRPGSWMVSPYGCTMNFVFAKSGKLGIGTAGHCADKVGQSVILLTLAPGRGNPVLVKIGTVVARHDNGIGDDFAVVEIFPELHSWVSATTAVIGGPCSEYYGFGPESVWHYGHGLVIGTGGTPRGGVALKWESNAYGWAGAAIFGDSGSPVRVTDLKAAGDLTHLIVHRNWLPNYIAGTRIGKMLQIAKGWTLASSPLCL